MLRTKKKVMSEPKPCKTSGITEQKYLDLANTFQVMMKEKIALVKEQKKQIELLETQLDDEVRRKSNLEAGYLKALNELADERLVGARLATYKERSSKLLSNLHKFITNERDESTSDSEYESDDE